MSLLVSILNPALGSQNLGDWIIAGEAKAHLQNRWPGAFFVDFPTKEAPGAFSARLQNRSRATILTGSNILSSEMNRSKQWNLPILAGRRVKNVVLLGVGWHGYQDRANRATRALLGRVLHPQRLQSVRDAYSEAQLRDAGFENVINTGCPTLWSLTPAHCAQIPISAAPHVVATLTDYRRDAEADLSWLRALCAGYERVFLWPQGSKDGDYWLQLRPQLSPAELKTIELLPSNLRAFEKLLNSEIPLDYIGTRLHGGIRALLSRRRALILGVDNRATEMGRDFGIPVAPREDLKALGNFLRGETKTEICLPHENIERWLSQWDADFAVASEERA